MALIVQKYGGTSVGSVERIGAVADRGATVFLDNECHNSLGVSKEGRVFNTIRASLRTSCGYSGKLSSSAPSKTHHKCGGIKRIDPLLADWR